MGGGSDSIPQVIDGGGQTGDIQYLAGIGVSSNFKLPLITKHPL